MKTPRFVLLAAAACLAAVLTGCATNAAQPGNTPDAAPTTDAPGTDVNGLPEMQAVWVGSESIIITAPGDGCRPTLTDVVVGDQSLDVRIEKLGGEEACMQPLIVYGHLLVIPAGIDTSKPLTLNVTNWDDQTADIELAGNSDGGLVPADKMIQPAPAAVWVNDSDIAVLTYGSSSCAPIGGEFTGEGETLTLKLTDPDTQMCTMDYAPRVTIIHAPDVAKDASFILSGYTDENEKEIVLQLKG